MRSGPHHAATLRARVPFLHFFDGFRTSHEVNKLTMLSDDDIRAMIPDELVRAQVLVDPTVTARIWSADGRMIVVMPMPMGTKCRPSSGASQKRFSEWRPGGPG